MLDDDKDRAYEAVYKEAVRALDLQRAALDVMRTRVGFLMSAATIATSFLGGLALKDRAGIGGWVAIVPRPADPGLPDRDQPAGARDPRVGRGPRRELDWRRMAKPSGPDPMRPFPGDVKSPAK